MVVGVPLFSSPLANLPNTSGHWIANDTVNSCDFSKHQASRPGLGNVSLTVTNDYAARSDVEGVLVGKSRKVGFLYV
jgi:hypothetical protein